MNNPKDVYYGEGQYLSDIVPGEKSPNQLSRALLGHPFSGSRFTPYVEIDTAGLTIERGRQGVYVVPNIEPLDISNRIRSSKPIPR